MEREVKAFVYFATGSPGNLLGAITLGIVHTLSCSKMTHCMFGYGKVVVDPLFEGVHFRRTDAVLLHYPNLQSIFEIPITSPVDVLECEYLCGQKQLIVPRLWRFITNGRYGYVYDCVSIVENLLEMGGIDGFDRMVTPKALHDALKARGFTRYSRRYIQSERSNARRHARSNGSIEAEILDKT